MINVLSIVTFKVFPPQMGGQKGVVLFYNHLKRFVNITIAASKDNSSKDFDVEEILYPNKLFFLNIFSISKLKKIIKEKSIDVILVEHSYPALLAYFLHKSTGVPYIIHSHNIEGLRFKQMNRWWWKWYLKYEKWVHQKGRYNFFISEEDREFAVENFKVKEEKSFVIPYGINIPIETRKSKEEIRAELGLPNEQLFFFNGTLNYLPNKTAVENLIDYIEPLLSNSIKNFKVIICGKFIEAELLKKLEGNKNLIYKGFVENINDYYKACDLFLNPVVNNSGVKTKVIEALANGCTVISFQSGAAGIPLHLCDEKLLVVNDNDWKSFANTIVEDYQKNNTTTPQSFYNYFNWNNIALNAYLKIEEVVGKK